MQKTPQSLDPENLEFEFYLWRSTPNKDKLLSPHTEEKKNGTKKTYSHGFMMTFKWDNTHEK